ncbi:MAG: hypothetical protein GY737_08460, partial [Desulfobacteraceae bacterium]|nr:hypothetical protein [Desulfobacteraceae bacterium]
MVKGIINASNNFCNPVSKYSFNATNLSPAERKDISIKTLAGGCVTEIADSNNVSRKFIYKQKEIANKGLDHAFNPVPKDDAV